MSAGFESNVLAAAMLSPIPVSQFSLRYTPTTRDLRNMQKISVLNTLRLLGPQIFNAASDEVKRCILEFYTSEAPPCDPTTSSRLSPPMPKLLP